MMTVEEFSKIVYTLGELEDNGREVYGEQWGEAISLAYRDSLEHVLPAIPLEDHDRFSRALFTLRGAAHREMGLDEEPKT